MKKILSVLLAVLMLLSALTGCGSKNETQAPSTQTSEPGSTTNSGEKTEEPSAAEAAYKDTVIWAQASDVTSMDPHVGKETAAVTVTCNIFSTLMIVLGDSERGIAILPREKQQEFISRIFPEGGIFGGEE